MGSIALQRVDVIVGVDTHKAEHVGFAIDGLGGDLGELQIVAVPAGYAQLLAWADSLGPAYAFGVEGTGSYGSGLAKFLRRHGRKVIEVSRPPRAGERRATARATPSTPNTPPVRSSQARPLPHRSLPTASSKPCGC